MTKKKTDQAKPVELTDEELSQKEIEGVVGGVVVDPAANWDLFAGWPDGTPSRASIKDADLFPVPGRKW